MCLPALPAVPQAKDGEAIQLRMLVHSRLCGTLIGKGGATIRSFNEDSHAVFNISPPPTLPGASQQPMPAAFTCLPLCAFKQHCWGCLLHSAAAHSPAYAPSCCLGLAAAGLTERIVKITGDVDHLMRAVALVVTKLRCGGLVVVGG